MSVRRAAEVLCSTSRFVTGVVHEPWEVPCPMHTAMAQPLADLLIPENGDPACPST